MIVWCQHSGSSQEVQERQSESSLGHPLAFDGILLYSFLRRYDIHCLLRRASNPIDRLPGHAATLSWVFVIGVEDKDRPGKRQLIIIPTLPVWARDTTCMYLARCRAAVRGGRFEDHDHAA